MIRVDQIVITQRNDPDPGGEGNPSHCMSQRNCGGGKRIRRLIGNKETLRQVDHQSPVSQTAQKTGITLIIHKDTLRPTSYALHPTLFALCPKL